MQRRHFIRIAGGGAIAAATVTSAGLSGCSAGMPAEAIEAWQGPGRDAAPDGDVRRWLLSYAILAPHSHNLQSWVVDLGTPNEILLSCDLKRLLPQTDPQSRQIMMSHGTFLELLDLAARERGLRADVALFPQGVFGAEKLDGRPVARIRLSPDASVQKDPLFAQILRRHTNRSAYDLARPVPAGAWAAMLAAVKPHPLRFGFAGPEQADRLAEHRRIAAQAWRIELTTPRTVMESFAVLRVGASEVAAHRDGLSLLDPMVVLLDRVGLFDRSKAPGPDDYATTSQVRDFGKTLDATPGFLWLVSEGNDRATQINAGRAYARVQLAATAQGLSMQPLSQALQEYAEQEKPYQEIHALAGAAGPGQTVQMWARVGYAPPVPPAPRRRLQDFIRA
ncbi:MAG: twin-arginine translocation pathway signal protein [Rhodoferax sp.]|uniref:Acg family FMN-binding oxidoreductase n=1 Tax=Rhodoferax sp. TaxID=50421 RepID=UPI002726EC68|nr:twin-arginine translocation pathway signal protein [Rhodoferax sp.]MDO8449353.1 twin-arginine translocation pathway signal protein [Rhodoferax sp.]